MTKTAVSEAVVDIPLAQIRVPAEHRQINSDWVEALAADFKARGDKQPMQPIEVSAEDKGGFVLRFGGHRMAAVALLGGRTIRAFVRDAEGGEVRMREISENLIRRANTVLERAGDIADWRDLFAEGKARAKSDTGLDEQSAKFALSFSEAAGRALNMSRRSIFLDLKVASIVPGVRRQIASLGVADNQQQLLAIAALSAARQHQVANLLVSGTAKSVNDAIAQVDGVEVEPAPEAWAKVSDRFSTLKEREQFAFFDAHEALIALWQVKRGLG